MSQADSAADTGQVSTCGGVQVLLKTYHRRKGGTDTAARSLAEEFRPRRGASNTPNATSPSPRSLAFLQHRGRQRPLRRQREIYARDGR